MNSLTSVETLSPTVNTNQSRESIKRLPGDLAMWFFILAELTVFAILFIGFAVSEQAATWLIIAKLVACLYIGVKIWEYFSLFELDIGIETNTFFTLYFMITFFHLMHVLLGMVILAFVTVKAAKNEYNASNISGFESGASYWHMVDMLWIILFPLIYVI